MSQNEPDNKEQASGTGIQDTESKNSGVSNWQLAGQKQPSVIYYWNTKTIYSSKKIALGSNI